jgi:YebC/PmpR family DNA-binding regulatory protein
MGRAHEVRAASMAKTAAAKSKLNNKWSKLIYMAAKSGVPDPSMNLALKQTIDKAKREQATADVIKRAIEKAKGNDTTSYTELLLEGFGPGNSQLVIEALTDNHNRTQTNVKIELSRCGGKIAQSGSVTHSFSNISYFVVKGMSGDEVLEALMNADCNPDDVSEEEDETVISAPANEYTKIKNALLAAKADLELVEDKITWQPMVTTELATDKEKEQFQRLLDLLNEDEDVQDIYYNVTNYEEPEE